MSSQSERRRVRGVCILLSICFLAVATRLIFIQVVRHAWWQAQSKQRETTRKLRAERGDIYDRNGHLLATNADMPSLFATQHALRDPNKTIQALASVPDARRIAKRIKNRAGKPFAWIARKTDPDWAAAVERRDIAGIGHEMESKRLYPKRTLAGHVLGFVGMDNNGLAGAEGRHDAALRGPEGARAVVQRDAHQRAAFSKNFAYLPPLRGEDIYLTIDEVIQHISERELEKAVQQAGAKGGVAMAMDPRNGEILSLAVAPRFNPNAFGEYAPSERRNRAIADFYEPGSTFKIVTAAAALESRVVSPWEQMDCERGRYAVPGAGRAVIHDHHPIGIVSFREAIARSSNICTVKVAQRLGPARLSSYIHAFGFGERLGIALGGEATGLVRDTAQWSKRSLASIAIGQEIGVTPLQMISAMSVIANGGHLMTPRIHLSCPETGCSALREPLPIRRVLSAETARTMTRILQGVVSEDGTGKRAAIPGFTVAGKTGTAQKMDPRTGRYSADRFVSSFVGFVPAENPVLTLLVVIDEPKGVAWGGEVAAPAFSAIGGEVLHYLRVPPAPLTDPLPGPPQNRQAPPAPRAAYVLAMKGP